MTDFTDYDWATWQTGDPDFGQMRESKEHLVDRDATRTACGIRIPATADVGGTMGWADACKRCRKIKEATR